MPVPWSEHAIAEMNMVDRAWKLCRPCNSVWALHELLSGCTTAPLMWTGRKNGTGRGQAEQAGCSSSCRSSPRMGLHAQVEPCGRGRRSRCH